MIRKLAFSLMTLVLLVLMAEGFCIIVKPDEWLFRDPYGGETVSMFRMLRYDAAVGWTGRPGAKVMHLDERLNRHGLRGADFPEEKQPGVVRIVAMGDSASFGVQMADVTRDLPLIVLDGAFPLLLKEKLGPYALPNRHYEVINAGVIGYSTLQGLRYLRREVLRWNPDVLLIRYGFNDHWVREPKYTIRPEPRNSALRWMYWQILRSRLHAFVKRSITALMESGGVALHVDATWPPPDGAPSFEEMRVPPEEFVFNLRLMVEEARSHRAIPILMNAPAAGIARESYRRHKEFTLFLKGTGYASDADIFRVHQRYNALVAQVAREENVPFIDLDAAFKARGREQFFALTELTHPNEAGNSLIAEMVLDELVRLGIVVAGPQNRSRPAARIPQKPLPRGGAGSLKESPVGDNAPGSLTNLSRRVPVRVSRSSHRMRGSPGPRRRRSSSSI